MRNPDGPFGKCPQCNITLSKDRTRELCKDNYTRCYNDTEDYRNILGVRLKFLPKTVLSFKGITRKVTSRKHISVGRITKNGIPIFDEVLIQIRMLVPIEHSESYSGFTIAYKRTNIAVIENSLRFKTVTFAQIANTFLSFMFSDNMLHINEENLQLIITNLESDGLSEKA